MIRGIRKRGAREPSSIVWLRQIWWLRKIDSSAEVEFLGPDPDPEEVEHSLLAVGRIPRCVLALLHAWDEVVVVHRTLRDGRGALDPRPVRG